MPKISNNSTSKLLASFKKSSTSKNKDFFEDQPVFYLGSEVKEHFANARDENGKKIVIGHNAFGQEQYQKEEESDGWQVAFVGSNLKPIYVVFQNEPTTLELGSFYELSGYGYKHKNSSIPFYLDEEIKLVKCATLTEVDPDVIVDEGAGD